MNSSPMNLKFLTKAFASAFTQVRIEISKILSGLYIRGSKKESDYGSLVYTGNIKYQIPQGYKEELDKLGYMFDVKRRFFEKDESYRSRILFTVKISATKKGMKNTLKFILENSSFFKDSEFDVEVRETVNDYFDGCTTPTNAPIRNSSLIGGIIVYITPKVKVRYFDAEEKTVNLEEFPDIYNSWTVKKPFYKFTKNVDHLKLIESGEFLTLRAMIESIAAAGIVVDRVVFQQSGASGNKGEYYAYQT